MYRFLNRILHPKRKLDQVAGDSWNLLLDSLNPTLVEKMQAASLQWLTGEKLPAVPETAE